ncbi:VOC family protein [Polaromonas sp. SM01]|uniref:VOC family protein n=1 Tax=Polaromonas sp. SM01 TaxID=3085630 RepID=UPI0029814224|nr:VOC family protein [Polaromonas sp. SM01]MDW5443009.1 VOC family protein [Polaromonas sp. SM01]
MLNSSNAMATIAVKDVARARTFYVDQLGLQPLDDGDPGLLTLRSGSSTVLVYHSPYAGSNQATAATWAVGDNIEALVQSLKDNGVAFEHYELPDTTRRGDFHVSGERMVAWCKDPDGNILCLVNT